MTLWALDILLYQGCLSYLGFLPVYFLPISSSHGLNMTEKIAVIGLGYVGLPVALACAEHFETTMGFDIDCKKVEELKSGYDRSAEMPFDVLKKTTLKMTYDEQQLKDRTFFIVAVPTPVDKNNRPDLTPLLKASEMVGRVIQKGSVVVFESTVYPGVTEDICGPVIARVSGLIMGHDFKLGYSPERINPGDKEHTLDKITKVISGEDKSTLDRIAMVYGSFVSAGLFRASSIKVAEAAKVIENTQRDLNIALMNELSLIFDKIGISTQDVLAAARTKWNFLPFTPGLVGGHCIGVDPYYLTTKAEELGYQPQVILAGRRINNSMSTHIAQRMVKMLSLSDSRIKGARVGILGLTFKENVSDLRNSRVPEIISELRQFGVHTLVHDPLADPHAAYEEYGLKLMPMSELVGLDGIILAVPHQAYLNMGQSKLLMGLNPNGVIIDVRSALVKNNISKDIRYFSL